MVKRRTHTSSSKPASTQPETENVPLEDITDMMEPIPQEAITLPKYIQRINTRFGDSLGITANWSEELDEQGNVYYIAKITKNAIPKNTPYIRKMPYINHIAINATTIQGGAHILQSRLRRLKRTATVMKTTKGYLLIVPEDEDARKYMKAKTRRRLFYTMTPQEYESFKGQKNSSKGEIRFNDSKNASDLEKRLTTAFAGEPIVIEDRQYRKYSVAVVQVKKGEDRKEYCARADSIVGDLKTAESQKGFVQYFVLMDERGKRAKPREGGSTIARRYCLVRPLFRTQEEFRELEFRGKYTMETDGAKKLLGGIENG